MVEGRAGANAEPGAPEIGVEGPGLSQSHSEHTGLSMRREGDESHSRLFSNPDSYCRTCSRPQFGGCCPHPQSVLLLCEFPLHFHPPGMEERQFLSEDKRTGNTRVQRSWGLQVVSEWLMEQVGRM